MKRRLIHTLQSVCITGGVTVAELVLLGLLRLVFRHVSAPALFLTLLNLGGASAFLLVLLLSEKALKLSEKLALMILPLLIAAVNVSQLFPLASAWWICVLVELLGAMFGGVFAAFIKVSGEQSRMEERIYGCLERS